MPSRDGTDEFDAWLRSNSAQAYTNREENPVSRMMFVNLPVTDLQRSVDFWTRLGFSFDPRFTDENASCMVISDDAYVMLLAEPFFSMFTVKEVADAGRHTEAILAVSASSRDEVDRITDTAISTGGSASNEPQEEDFMYGRSFQDPDGHLWEVLYMDPAAAEQV
ncbi:MAG TPA: VOC family protein [Nocardioidaceae bacterium]